MTDLPPPPRHDAAPAREPLVDLHMHGTASDGELEPAELAGLCSAAGLSTVALTDHNTTRNVTVMTEMCAGVGVEVIPACEISTDWQGREFHCLAYWVPLDDPAFSARIERIRAADEARSRAMVENAAAAGIPWSWATVVDRIGDRVPPFALLSALLLEVAGDDPRMLPYHDRRGSLWPDWFAPGRPWGADAPYRPALTDAIGWVRDVGGVPVLAHPGASLGPLDPDDTLAQLRGHGLGGVEAWTTWHRENVAQRFDALGRRLGLAVTAGADFHGPRVKSFVPGPGAVTHNGPGVLAGLEAERR